ncbi:MAG: response regulator [Planctomycetota bacterium]
MADDDDVLDADGAAQYLKINVQTVRRLARAKEIPAFRVGGAWRFRKTWLDRWAEAQHAGTQEKKHVVVVDDEEVVLEFIKRALTSEDCTVSTATNGPDALELMDRQAPDLVILDLLMPGMDGPTTLERIREKHRAVPVIILTAYPDSKLMHRAMQHSPIMLLTKPPRLKQFLEAIRTVIGPRTEARP